MNKYQRAINQIAKDDIEYPIIPLSRSFYRTRKATRIIVKGCDFTFKRLVGYKEFNKSMNISLKEE